MSPSLSLCFLFFLHLFLFLFAISIFFSIIYPAAHFRLHSISISYFSSRSLFIHHSLISLLYQYINISTYAHTLQTSSPFILFFPPLHTSTKSFCLSLFFPSTHTVPFSEDDNDGRTWFFDHTFAERMFDMMHKVDGMHLSLAVLIFQPTHPHSFTCQIFASHHLNKCTPPTREHITSSPPLPYQPFTIIIITITTHYHHIISYHTTPHPIPSPHTVITPHHIPSHPITPCPVREHVVGWYTTGPRTRRADVAIHDLFYKYV